MNKDAFETLLLAMKASIRSSYSKKVAALMLPDDEAERITHAACEVGRVSCSCRVCYWANPKLAMSVEEPKTSGPNPVPCSCGTGQCAECDDNGMVPA